jgi:uncharacterized protein (TIGR02996 family)
MATVKTSVPKKSGRERYVLNGPGGERFWEIERVDTVVTTRFGKRGGDARAAETRHPDRASAELSRDKRIRDKRAEGYVAAATVAPVGASSIAGVSRRNDELEAAIEQAPDAVDNYLVYADWLQAEGDPRGELIAAQHAALQDPRSPRLERTVNDILKKFHGDLLGPLAELPAVRHVGRRLPVFDWHLGFIRFARLWRTDRAPSVLEQARTLVEHPSARFLRVVALGAALWEFSRISGTDYRQAIELLVERGPGTIDSIFVGEGHLDGLASLEAPWRGIKRLRALWVHGSDLDLAEPLPASLEVLELCTQDLSDRTLATVCDADLPELTSLTLWGANREAHRVRALERLLGEPRRPRLAHLGVRSLRGEVDAVVPLIAKAAALRTLRRLTLDLGAAGVRAITERAHSFEHHDRIDLAVPGDLDGATKQTLRACLPKARLREFDYTALSPYGEPSGIA